MFQILSHDALLARPLLRSSLHFARAQQFCDRHKWNVSITPEGFEVDQFDDQGTTYLVVAEGQKHLASLRLRAARDGNMVEEAFPTFWQRHGSRLIDTVEVTRLCSTPHVTCLERQLAVAELLLGLCRHCRETGKTRIFGIVFPGVARTLSRVGWAPEILEVQGHGRQSLHLARWTATAVVDWTLQESVARLTDACRNVPHENIPLQAVA